MTFQNDALFIRSTQSLCPTCLTPLSAQIVRQGDSVYLCRTCPEHGLFSEVIWRGTPLFESWVRPKKPHRTVTAQTEVEKGCPSDCGRCPNHKQQACSVLFEITDACNLYCPVCFAAAPKKKTTSFSSLATLIEQAHWIKEQAGEVVLQLSGGEPTLHPDLIPLVRHVSTLFPAVQLNSNGVELAKKPSLAKDLANAGLSWVFLQFDGTSDDIYTALRGKPLLHKKMTALENCKKAGLSVVLVPTVVEGINDHDLGNLLDLAILHAPLVRGLHLQPMTRSGRNIFQQAPHHLTLPEVLQLLCEQSKGRILEKHATPPGCEHERCAFHCRYRLLPDKTLVPMRKQEGCCSSSDNQKNDMSPCPSPFANGTLPHAPSSCCSPKEPEDAQKGASRAINTIIRSWTGANKSAKKLSDQNDFDAFIADVRSQTFSVTCMAFQDAWSVDLERLQGCCIHIFAPPARLVPFCSYNMTAADGTFLHRQKKC